MEYNTTRNKLVIPEYGRHIQRMIEQTCLIEDREMRNVHAQSIVNVMGTMLPHLRDVVDFKHKLWDHLFIISNFKLDVDSPFPIPSVMTYQVKPKKLSYPTYKIRYAHYGKTVEKMIAEIRLIADGPSKQKLIVDLANFMKLLYVTWNKESLDDQLIIDQLRELSKGDLRLSDGFKLAEIREHQQGNGAPIKAQKRQIRPPARGAQKPPAGAQRKKY